MKIQRSVELAFANVRDKEVRGEGSTPNWLHEDITMKIKTITQRRNSTDYSNDFAAHNNRTSRINNEARDNDRSGGAANIVRDIDGIVMEYVDEIITIATLQGTQKLTEERPYGIKSIKKK